MEVDIEATTDSFRMVAVLWRWILKRQPIVLGWLLFYGFMEVDIEATTDSFRMVAVLWRWILKRQPIVLGWLLFYGGGYWSDNRKF